MSIIDTKSLTKHYRRGSQIVRALNGVSLEIEEGSFVAIIGRSGSGKSTLLNLIGCLDRPTSGTVSLRGMEISHARERDLAMIRRREVGFVFQQCHLLPRLTALENVLLPLKYNKVPASEAFRRATKVLEVVGMKQGLRHLATDFSGGEQQRIAIARALVNSPTVVLADEPTGDLDTQSAMAILNLMKNLNQELNQTFLIVTHDPSIGRLATRIVKMKDGAIEPGVQSGMDIVGP